MKYVRFFFLPMIAVVVLYLALMLRFRTAIPGDLAHHLLGDTWSVDSASIFKRPFHLSQAPHVAGCQADTGCEVYGEIYLWNNIHRVLRVDSLILHERSRDLFFRADARIEVSSGETLDRGTVVFKEPFRIFFRKSHIWTNGGLWTWSDPYTWRSTAEMAFERSTFELIVYADRDSIIARPAKFISGNYGKLLAHGRLPWKKATTPVTLGLPQHFRGF